nr:hypothetical protein BaRGS_028183 [Batillaria attramentaria]
MPTEKGCRVFTWFSFVSSDFAIDRSLRVRTLSPGRTTAPRATDIKMAAEIDLVNRDAYNVNEHLNIQFEDLIAEPDGLYTFEFTWVNSFKCFILCQDFCLCGGKGR